MPSRLQIIGLFALVLFHQARAEELVHYDNPKKDGTSKSFDSRLPQPPIATHPLVIASDLRNSGVTGVDHIEMYQTDGWPAQSMADPSRYIHFSVSPAQGYQLNLDSFEIDLWQSGHADNPRAFSLRWDLDGFSSDLLVSPISPDIGKTSYSFPLVTLNSRATASEFRLYFHDSSIAGQNTAVIAMGSTGDGFRLNGTVTPLFPRTFVGFDQARYDVFPGEAFVARVLVEPPPASGLASYGVKLTFPASNALVADFAAVTVPPQLNFNGVLGEAAVKSVGEGYAAAKGTVNFFANPPQAYPGAHLASFTVKDLAPGPYTLRLGFFNTLGPTENIFVDGAGGLLDSNITFGTALVNHRPSVRITNPTNGATFLPSTIIPLAAAAGDDDGAVVHVEFSADGIHLATAKSAPYAFDWASAQPGTHTLTAVAVDGFGARSAPHSIVIFVGERQSSQGCVIFASEANEPIGSKVVNWNGHANAAKGKIHSNSDIDVSGNKHLFRDGPLEYVTGINPALDFGGKATLLAAPLTQSTVLPYPVDFPLADFAPGGPEAGAAQALGKYHHIRGDMNLSSLDIGDALEEGLYFVEGNIHLTGSGLRGRVTLVATGEIEINSARSTFQSYTRCLLAYSAKRTWSFDEVGIRLAGSHIKGQGILFAPEGGISVAGQSNSVLVGSLIARGVTVTGTGFQITGLDINNCTPLVAPLRPALAGRTLQLSIPTVAGLSYTVEYTDSLSAPHWKPLAVVIGDGTTRTLKQPSIAPERYYRLRVD